MQKQIVLRTYKERAGMRGLERIFKSARQKEARRIIELAHDFPDLKDTLLPVQPDDIL